MSETSTPIVAEGVSYEYDSGLTRHHVLRDVSMEIEAGEIVILTGPSGSGKTTLITLIGALRSMQSGSIKIFGDELSKASQRSLMQTRRKIGFIFQQHNLLDYLSVARNISMSLSLGADLSGAKARARIEEVLDQVGLAEHIDKFPGALSGGQKQRVGIARALASGPKMILADEPTASLDKESGRNVVNLIQELCREQGASVVMVTHDNRILDVADRILHLEDGQIQSMSAAVASSTSQMLKLLNRHDPDAADYMSAFSQALTRVALADDNMDDQERDAIRHILVEQSDLHAAEVDLVMEMAMSQVRCRSASSEGGKPRFSAQQSQHFLASLHAVAAADGEVSPQELAEINQIARELGFDN
jgi:putative ABC transport system ATP-binding protein